MMYYESKYAEITWDEGSKIVILRYKGYLPSEQFREIANKTLELLTFKKGKKLLSDNSNFTTLTKPDEEWTNTDWFPRALNGGLKKLAVVVPGKTIQKNVVERILDKAGEDELFQTHNFSSVEDAMDWLK